MPIFDAIPRAVTETTAPKCNLLEKIAEMAGKEIGAIREISEVNFKDFFQSRIMKTKAISAPRYALKVATKLLMMPLYYGAFKLYQFGDSLPVEQG